MSISHILKYSRVYWNRFIPNYCVFVFYMRFVDCFIIFLAKIDSRSLQNLLHHPLSLLALQIVQGVLSMGNKSYRISFWPRAIVSEMSGNNLNVYLILKDSSKIDSCYSRNNEYWHCKETGTLLHGF